jgi:hypothetical protein
MSDLILRQADIDRFTSTLDKLARKTHVAMEVLVHRDGHLLSSAGQAGLLDTTALSALVSANFSSTVAIANLVGEKEFTVQHHAGKNKSIIVSLIDDYTFLVSIFENGTPLDPIRTCTDEFRPELLSALQKLYNNEPDGPLPTGEDFEKKDDPQVQMIDAEEAARIEAKHKSDAAPQPSVVPRRLSYTTRPPKERDAAPAHSEGHPRVIKEPDADDADLEALANAISSKGERTRKPAPGAKKESAEADVIMVEGKPMTVVSLKNKGTSR